MRCLDKYFIRGRGCYCSNIFLCMHSAAGAGHLLRIVLLRGDVFTVIAYWVHKIAVGNYRNY